MIDVKKNNNLTVNSLSVQFRIIGKYSVWLHGFLKILAMVKKFTNFV
jgi:hypothetical protein